MAAITREMFAGVDKTNLVVERSPWSSTGFKQIIKVKGKYQARLQVKGDGRGGERKRAAGWGDERHVHHRTARLRE